MLSIGINIRQGLLGRQIKEFCLGFGGCQCWPGGAMNYKGFNVLVNQSIIYFALLPAAALVLIRNHPLFILMSEHIPQWLARLVVSRS